MSDANMHADQIDVDGELVRTLLRDQHPRWADLDLQRFDSSGTVNAIYRLGLDMYVRLPLARAWAGDLLHEMTWLPRLAPLLPVPIPGVVAEGTPSDDYPFAWAVYRWIEGETWDLGRLHDENDAARDLAAFLAALHDVDPKWLEPLDTQFDVPLLAAMDDWIRESVDKARDMIDATAVLAVWDSALELPPFSGPHLWVHGDLSADNVLVAGGRMSAVIDWGACHVGDAARDLAGLWGMLSDAGRTAFREVYPIEEATWHRARAWALRAVGGLDYYRHSNPRHVANCLVELQAVLADVARGT